MLEVKSSSESNLKQPSPKMVTSPKLGRKSSWKEVNALLKNSYQFATLNSDFTFGSSPRKLDSKHATAENSDNESSSIRATESLGSIEWNMNSRSDISVLTSRSMDTYGSKMSSDNNLNFDKDTSFVGVGGVAFRNPHRMDSFDDADIQKVDTVEDDDEDEQLNEKLVKVIEPDDESIVIRSRGNWIGGESLSTNKLVMLLSDMEVCSALNHLVRLI